jgi:hypothetical protein
LDPKMGTTQISCAGNSGYSISHLSTMHAISFLDIGERQMRERECYFIIH